ncbi:actin-binding protein IPP [Nematostella vectensis]|nr:actin-binding protein IPP [Nematostella vectensis]
MLQLDAVEKCCCDFLMRQLEHANCLGIYLFAEAHSCADLSTNALEFIHRNFVLVCESEEYLELDRWHLLQLLDSEDLKIESECQVFEAAMRWVMFDMRSRREALGKILERIRLPLISPKYFEKFLSECQNESLHRMLGNILEGYRSYQSLAHSAVKGIVQPRRASRKCFYIIGGYSRSAGGRWSDTASLANVEKFDTFTQTCYGSTPTSMSYPRSGHCVASVSGLVYAIGGENDSLIYDITECYDPTLNSWSVVAPLTAPRVACGACVVDGFIYVLGGWVGSEIADSIERYDPKENLWEIVGKVETKRLHLGVTELHGNIYVIGGISELGEQLKCTESFNPLKDKWTKLADMSTRRSYLGVASLGDAIYAVGGENEHEGVLRSVERYDYATDEWVLFAMLETPRAGLSLATNNNMLYVIGGRTAGGEFSAPITMATIEVYNQQKNKWTHASDLSLSRCEFGVGIV